MSKDWIQEVPPAAVLMEAAKVREMAEGRILKRMTDAGIPGASVSLFAHNDGLSIELSSDRKVFLHPNGRRLYERVNMHSYESAEREIAEVETWLSARKPR